MIYLVRASHANEFELQNYAPLQDDLDLKLITTAHPLTATQLEGIPLWSPTELPHFAFRRQILNRLIGGEQWLLGLDKKISKRYNDLNHYIVHTAETYTPYTHQVVQLRKHGDIGKLICTCWETIPHNNEKFARLRGWKAEAYQYVDLFHTPTERAKQALITEGVSPSKIVVIPYGVDLTRFKPRRHKSNPRPLVLTVARFTKEKGMEDIEAVARALPKYDFLVVGSGTYPLRGSNIKTISVSYSEIPQVYGRADLFFLPSRSTKTWEEQYGMALIEAMACGLPIVTTASGAIPEVVGNSGIFVKERDTQSMIDQITALITDQSRSAKLAQLASARATKLYDSSKVAAKLAQLY